MSTARTERGRAAHAAEKARTSTIEAVIGETARGAGIDFEAARTRELERVEIIEPSALALARLRQLGLLGDDNALIFRSRTSKGRHYTERP